MASARSRRNVSGDEKGDIVTLGALQIEAIVHRWEADRLPPLTALDTEATTRAFRDRAIKERMIELASLANEWKVSLDAIAKFLCKEMR